MEPKGRACGCYYTLKHPSLGYPMRRLYLPQVDLKAQSSILSATSRTVLTQSFRNPSSSDPITEASYTFPIYDGVTVVGFNCRIGSRVIRGIVKDKDAAAKVYSEALAAGQTAGLLEQLFDAPDVFTTRIGNIPADGLVTVEITYLGELKHDSGVDGIRFTLPTMIAPRYGPTPDAFSHPHGLAANSRGGIEITVDVSMEKGSNIRGIQSPSHPIAVTMGSTSRATQESTDFDSCQASATLSLGSTELEKDFVLLILANNIAVPKALLEIHPTIANQRALMATLVPKFSLPPSRPEIVFVADRSGSMDEKMPTLISAMKVFLKSLPIGIKFNICSFGSSHSFLWPRSMAYDQTNLRHATRHVESFQSNMGGTEIFSPLRAAINNRFKDLPLEIILLTDGEVWDQSHLFRYLNKEIGETRAPIRVFSLGVGQNVSHPLVEGLAAAGNGLCQIVLEHEKLESKVVRMLKGALSPHINDYTLELKYKEEGNDGEVIERVAESFRHLMVDTMAKEIGSAPAETKPISLFDQEMDVDATDQRLATLNQSPYAHLPKISPPKLLQAPHKIPPLFPFTRSVVYLLLSPQSTSGVPTSVVLRATSEHGPLELEIPVSCVPEPQETIHQLAAKKAVGELEAGRGWIYDATDEGGVPLKERFEGRWDEIVKREAIRLGVQYQVGGKWCSFVAVESNEEELLKMAEERKRTNSQQQGDPAEPDHRSVRPRRSVSPSHGFEDTSESPRPFSDTSSAISTGTFTSASVSSQGYTALELASRSPTGVPAPAPAPAPSPGMIPAIYRGRTGGGAAAAPKSLSAAESANVKYMVPKQKKGPRIYPTPVESHQMAQQPPPNRPAPSPSFSWAPPQAQTRMLMARQNVHPQDSGLIEYGSNPAAYGPTTPASASFGASGANGGGGRFGSRSSDDASFGTNGSFAVRRSSDASGAALPTLEQSAATPQGTKKKRSRPSKNESLRSQAPVDGQSSASRAEDKDEGFSASSNESALRRFRKSAPEKQQTRGGPLPRNNGDRLHLIISLQSFDGSWTLDDGLLEAMGVQPDVLDRLLDDWPLGSYLDDTKQLRGTIFAIVFLETELMQDCESWELVVEKARYWLIGQGETLEGGRYEKAREVLQKARGKL